MHTPNIVCGLDGVDWSRIDAVSDTGPVKYQVYLSQYRGFISHAKKNKTRRESSARSSRTLWRTRARTSI